MNKFYPKNPMNRVDLIKLLCTFSNEEFYRFGKFINSPYHNSVKILSSFFQLLKEYYPDFEDDNFTKENIFLALYSGKKYNDGVIRNLFSDMKKKAEEFLAYECFREDNFYFSRVRLSEIRNRNLVKNFLNVYNFLKSDTDKTLQIDSEFFYKKYLLDNEMNHLMLENKIVYKIDMMSDNLENMLSNLIHSIVAQAFRIYIQFFILKRGKQDFNFDFKYMKEIENIYSKLNHNPEQSHYLNFVYTAFKIYQTGEKVYYNRLLKIKDESIDRLNDHDKSNLYNTLIICSYDYIVKGELDYIETLFKIMKEYAGKKLYREGSHDNIPEFAYLNILSIGIFANQIEWTEEFYRTHINKLFITNRENLRLYSEALIAYSKNEYEEALEHLSKLSTRNFAKIDIFSIKYKIKSLQLKIFYDLNQNDLFYSSIDTFRHFAYNDKLTSENNKLLVLDFIKFISRLFVLRNSNSGNISYEISKLRKDLLKENIIIDKIWLLKKIEEL